MMNTRRKSKRDERKHAQFLWLGLTGGIATGKSTVSKIFQDLGLAVIDADIIAHEALLPKTASYEEIVQVFGKEILKDDGCIDRQLLAKKIFQNEAEKFKLESIVHPYVQKRVVEMQQVFLQAGHRAMIYDVPLLFEKQMQGQFDFTLIVTCSEALQVLRMKQRNRWTDEEIALRLKNQMPLDMKEQCADFVIENNGSMMQLQSAVEEIFAQIKLLI